MVVLFLSDLWRVSFVFKAHHVPPVIIKKMMAMQVATVISGWSSKECINLSVSLFLLCCAFLPGCRREDIDMVSHSAATHRITMAAISVNEMLIKSSSWLHLKHGIDDFLACKYFLLIDQ